MRKRSPIHSRLIFGAHGVKACALALLGMVALHDQGLAATVADDCDRQCLKKLSDQYFVALAAHDPSMLPVSSNVKFVENNAILKFGEGHWKGGSGKETYRLQIFDPEQGGIGVLTVIPSAVGPAVMALRLKVEHRLISEVEAVVVYKGKDMVVPEHLAGTEPSRYWTRTLRVSERNNRYELMGATEAYWVAFQGGGTPDYRPAPLMPDTVRTENGAQTTLTSIPLALIPPGQREKMHLPAGQSGIPTGTAAEQFDAGTFKGIRINDRRYPVVDVETGAVLSLVRFADSSGTWVPAQGGKVVGEFFAITEGRIVEIAAAYTPPTNLGASPWH